MNHAWFKGGVKKNVAYEIGESKKVLQDMLGVPVATFAYPYGAFDTQAAKLTRDAGFTNAVSTVADVFQSPENMYYYSRLHQGYRTGKELLDFVNQDKFKPW